MALLRRGLLAVAVFSLLHLPSICCGSEPIKIDNPGFENENENWEFIGDVSLDNKIISSGKNSLRLSRKKTYEKQPTVKSKKFKINHAEYKFSVFIKAAKLSDSPDPSYNAGLYINLFNNQGEFLYEYYLGGIRKKQDWACMTRKWIPPENAAFGQLILKFSKITGTVWFDDIKIEKIRDIENIKIKIASSENGHLFYPEKEWPFNITVVSNNEIPAQNRKVVLTIMDSHGAQTALPFSLQLADKTKKEKFVYQVSTNLKDYPLNLKQGSYYDLEISLKLPSGKKIVGNSSFAILSEAANNHYSADIIPFGLQGWGMREPKKIRLVKRLGARWLRFHLGWDLSKSSEPMSYWNKLKTPDHILYAKKLGINVIAHMTPVKRWEEQEDGKETLTLKQIKDGAYHCTLRYPRDGVSAFKLGNEPGHEKEVAEHAVHAYKAAYEGIKEANPNFLVTASPAHVKTYLEAGYGKYCDVLDIHQYSELDVQRRRTVEAINLAKKAGVFKPLWTTELGNKSMGLSRRQIAIECVAKHVAFFADGGSHVDWFALQAQPQAKGTFKDGFCLFDTAGAPRKDAIAYFHVINLIGTKKFVKEIRYPDGTNAFLFRDNAGKALIVVWNRQQKVNVHLPVPEIKSLTLTYIDGRTRDISIKNELITLRITEEPIFLTFTDKSFGLPKKLDVNNLKIEMKEKLIPGNKQHIIVKTNDSFTSDVNLSGGNLWEINKTKRGNGIYDFTVELPAESKVKNARFYVELLDKQGNLIGEVTKEFKVEAQLSIALIPGINREKNPVVRLQISNNLNQKVVMKYNMVMKSQATLGRQRKGRFNLNNPERAKATLEGQLTRELDIPARGIVEKEFPIKGLKDNVLYHTTVTVFNQDNSYKAEKWMGGFVPVLKTREKIILDGKDNEQIWKDSRELLFNSDNQWAKAGSSRVAKNIAWKGVQDLSGKMKLIWDDNYFYIFVTTVDDKFCNKECDSQLWFGDGIQFMIDPFRGEADNSQGFYNISAGHGTKGDQMWIHRKPMKRIDLPKELKMEMVSSPNSENNGRNYEIAIPWKMLPHFIPSEGKVLGLSLILNEDDGNGRYSYLTWFCGVSMKIVSQCGDIILFE